MIKLRDNFEKLFRFLLRVKWTKNYFKKKLFNQIVWNTLCWWNDRKEKKLWFDQRAKEKKNISLNRQRKLRNRHFSSDVFALYNVCEIWCLWIVYVWRSTYLLILWLFIAKMQDLQLYISFNNSFFLSHFLFSRSVFVFSYRSFGLI